MSPVQSTIHGTVSPGFEPVRATFEENFKRRGELGAGLCVWHRGAVVVDLWGGVVDKKKKVAWSADTLALIFSCTKGMAATALLMLADRGLLDYDAPVAEYWPEFAQNGKADITVRALLNHRAGVVGLEDPLTLNDFANHPERVADVCAKQAPLWAPGTKQGYHGVSYGAYTAELFRRIAGESMGTFFNREVSGALGADVYLGLPPDLEPRVATNYPAGWGERLLKVIPKLIGHRGLEGRVYRQVARRGSPAQIAFANPAELGPRGLSNYNRSDVRRMELPWCNAIASARGLARVYQALVAGGTLDGVRLMAPETIAPVHARQSWEEMDQVLRKPMGFSQGFVKEETRLFSPNTVAFMHPGAGGSLGMADPKAGIAMGYVMNQMGHHIRSPRALALCHSLYGCLDRLG
ncbi:MAG: CubicO group peptidase (beta-lactamase class C family) [Bradymonadia bacterium]|jgi:CubicO group peptidase (beta-lactamase class C family)